MPYPRPVREVLSYQQQWRFLLRGAAVVNLTGAAAGTLTGTPRSIARVRATVPVSSVYARRGEV
jgi:hypothetical protein